MKSEVEIRQAIKEIEKLNNQCPCKAHKESKLCLSASHAILGTYQAVLNWVLGEAKPLW